MVGADEVEKEQTMEAIHAVPERATAKLLDARMIFLLSLLLAGTGLVSPPVALLGGLIFGLTTQEHPMRAESARLSKFLLQAAVVLLGFGMNVREVVHAGSSGFAYTAMSISVALALGLLLGKLLRVERQASFLITIGTAICGGSAIAAVAPVLEAGEEAITISMGTVFAELCGPALVSGFGTRVGAFAKRLWPLVGTGDT